MLLLRSDNVYHGMIKGIPSRPGLQRWLEIALYTSSIRVHASAHITPTHVTTTATPARKTAMIQAKRPACQSLCCVLAHSARHV